MGGFISCHLLIFPHFHVKNAPIIHVYKFHLNVCTCIFYACLHAGTRLLTGILIFLILKSL
jgi:hypothetical protein